MIFFEKVTFWFRELKHFFEVKIFGLTQLNCLLLYYSDKLQDIFIRYEGRMWMTTSFKKSTFVNVVSSRKSNKNSLDIFWSFFFSIVDGWDETLDGTEILRTFIENSQCSRKIKNWKGMPRKKGGWTDVCPWQKTLEGRKTQRGSGNKNIFGDKENPKKKNQIKRKRTICVQG